MKSDEKQESNSENEQESHSEDEHVDTPWDLKEGDKFQYQDNTFKIIRKRKQKMTVKRLSDKKKITLRRS